MRHQGDALRSAAAHDDDFHGVHPVDPARIGKSEPLIPAIRLIFSEQSCILTASLFIFPFRVRLPYR